MLADHVQSWVLDGASLVLDWVEQTDSILVQSHHGNQLQPEVLTLYFESRRSGGGRVQAVRLLLGGTMAVVSFQDRTGEGCSRRVLLLHVSCLHFQEVLKSLL